MTAAKSPRMALAVTRALRGMTLQPEDAAAKALAQRYARDIDEAAVVSASLAKALRQLLELDPDLHDRFLVLATRIEDTAVLGLLGPKLLAALEQLGMTPRARASVLGKEVKGAPPKSRLDELRERRRARVDGTAAVDPSAP